VANTKLSDLRTMLRTLIDDSPVYFNDEIIGNGSSRQWAFTHKNIVVDSLGKIDLIEFNSVINTGDYTIDSNRGWITFALDNLPGNDVQVVLQYRYYENFSDTELDGYLEAAVGKLYLKGYCTWDVISGDLGVILTTGEKMLVCAVAAVIIDPNAAISWKTGEMSYSSRQNGVSGEELIDLIITQAKLLGSKTGTSFYLNIAGLNNDTNLEGDTNEYEV